MQPPNQSLKLTEVAVDDFAARQYAGIDMISRYVRATSYMVPAAIRRSSRRDPFRINSGPLGGIFISNRKPGNTNDNWQLYFYLLRLLFGLNYHP
jgi:hypothetical protein